MKWKNMVAMMAVASLSSGCAMYELEELRHTSPTGTPFQQELAKLYMDFATEDEKGYDWFNSWYFADKGLRAAYGKTVMPEDLKDWTIAPEALPFLERARGELMVALTPANEERHPTTLAHAQFYFDCWVQRQEENWQGDRIEYCRKGLLDALDDLGGAPVEKPVAAEVAPAKKHVAKAPAPQPKAEVKEAKAKPEDDVPPTEQPVETKEPKAEAVELKGAEENKEKVVAPKAKESAPAAKTKDTAAASAETMSYVVFFATDRPVITDPGEQVLDEVIKSLKGSDNYDILLKSGVGSDPRSPLFASRAEAITQRLSEGGVKAGSIKTAESEPASGSHRIEIFLSQ